MADWQVITGDCLDVLPTLEAASVDSIVTDPPYGLSFMGRDWDHGVPGAAFWREALRVAKPGAHLLAFGGTRTFHRLTCAIEDAGWEIRDCIMWVYGSGFPKSLNLGGEHEGWGTALKPAWEPIIVARKPLAGTVAENVGAHGTGALNIDGCRIAGVKPRMAAIDSDNRQNPILHTRSASGTGEMTTEGRWPANLIHDGSDEVLALFPQSNGGAFPKQGGTPTGKHYEGGWGCVDNGERTEMGSGSAARFFYCAKASKADRGDGNHHPTVKPTVLMRYLCRLVTPPGGVVLDPFVGSGSTGKAARLEGFGFMGIEREQEYTDIASRRISEAVPLGATA